MDFRITNIFIGTDILNDYFLYTIENGEIQVVLQIQILIIYCYVVVVMYDGTKY